MKLKSKTSFLDKLMRLTAVVLAVVLVLGFLAGRFDPREYKYVPFFGLAYPFILLFNFLMILWWCLKKRWSYALCTLALIFMGWHTLNTTFGVFGNDGEGPKRSDEHIRLMTYNVHSFKPFGQENVESVKQEMLDVIADENPDIVCFQEYFTRRKGSFDITDSLKRILKTPYYYFVPSSENDYEATGLAIFSRYPIKNKGEIKFEYGWGNGSIFADVLIGEKLVRIYNIHLQSISFQEQDYIYIDQVKSKMEPKLYASKRILKMLRSAFRKRSGQVDVMRAHMDNCNIPFVIAGDFNDTPASYAVKQMTKSLKNTFEEQGKGFGKTYNGKFPNFQIDYIATTQQFEIVNHRVIEAELSDHFPVRSDLILNP